MGCQKKLNPWMQGKEETVKECQERITAWTKNIEKAESPEDKEQAQENGGSTGENLKT